MLDIIGNDRLMEAVYLTIKVDNSFCFVDIRLVSDMS